MRLELLSLLNQLKNDVMLVKPRLHTGFFQIEASVQLRIDFQNLLVNVGLVLLVAN